MQKGCQTWLCMRSDARWRFGRQGFSGTTNTGFGSIECAGSLRMKDCLQFVLSQAIYAEQPSKRCYRVICAILLSNGVFVQLAKAASPMVSAAEGILQLLRLVQPEKASLPIVTIVDGSVTEVMELLPAKAPSPIQVTGFPFSLFGMVRIFALPV